MRTPKWFVSALVGCLVSYLSSAEDTAVRIGNPLLARFPVSGDARPRSIWDMHYFNGRIYIGSGDYWSNTGPTDIWTYRGQGTNFVKEFTVDEEMVCGFFEFDGKLFILIDGKLFSAPVIRSTIESGSGEITGQFTLKEATELAGALNAPLPNPVKVVEMKNF